MRRGGADEACLSEIVRFVLPTAMESLKGILVRDVADSFSDDNRDGTVVAFSPIEIIESLKCMRVGGMDADFSSSDNWDGAVVVEFLPTEVIDLLNDMRVGDAILSNNDSSSSCKRDAPVVAFPRLATFA